MRPWIPLLALSLAFPAGALLAQDKDDKAEAEPEDDQPFLDGDKQSCEAPPLQLTRPNDAWQFVDLERVRKERGVQPGNLKFHLWYGAARASIYVRAWVYPVVPPEVKDVASNVAEQQIKELQQLLQNAQLKSKKRAKVGKRAGIVFEVHGEAPDRRDRTKLKPVLIKKAVCFRPEDKAMLTVHLEYSDAGRTKQLDKEFKKLLKKVRF